MEQVKWDSSSLDEWQINDNKENKQRTQTHVKYCLSFSWIIYRMCTVINFFCCIILIHNGIYIVYLSLEGLKSTFSPLLLLQIRPCSQLKYN